MSEKCKLCKEHELDLKGSASVCAFEGRFANNYMCSTLSKLRTLCLRAEDEEISGLQHYFKNDQHYCTIDISDVLMEDESFGVALWVTWYKSRGRTEQIWVLDDANVPRRPTETEVLAICHYYEEVNK